jgi:hypothetical protein
MLRAGEGDSADCVAGDIDAAGTGAARSSVSALLAWPPASA